MLIKDNWEKMIQILRQLNKCYKVNLQGIYFTNNSSLEAGQEH